MDVKGYDFEFVDELSSDHTCSICLLGMRNPVQTAKCGHRFCDGCLFKALREADKRVCPLDSIPIPQEGGFFRDVAWERDILSHRVKCKRNERGCDWMGELRQYEEHFKNSCPYEDVVCIRCNDIKQRKFLPEHATSECSKRIVQCKYCVKEFEFWRTEIHEGEECNLFPLDCPQQCGISKMAREKLGFHIKDDCFMTLVTCPYSDAGCTFHDKRINLQAHIKDSTEDHLHKAWTQIAEVKEAVLKINKSEGHLKDRSRVEQFQPEKKRMEITLQRTIDETDKLKSLTTKLEKENRKIEQDVSGFTKRLSDVETYSQRNNEEINKFSSLATKLEKENRRLQEDVSGLAKQLSEMKTSLQIIKSGTKELMPSTTQLEEENRNLKKEVSELAKQLSDTKMSSQRNNEESKELRPLTTKLEEENRNLKKEVSELAKQLSDTKMSSQRNNEEINKIRPLMTQLEEENRNLKKEVSGMAKQLSDTKMSPQRNNEESKELRPLTTKLEEENRNLKKEVSGLAKQLSDTKMSSQRNNEEIKELRPLTTQLEEENRNMKREVSGLAKQLSDTKMSSQRNNEEIKKLRPLTTQLEGENRNLTDEVARLAKQLLETETSLQGNNEATTELKLLVRKLEAENRHLKEVTEMAKQLPEMNRSFTVSERRRYFEGRAERDENTS